MPVREASTAQAPGRALLEDRYPSLGGTAPTLQLDKLRFLKRALSFAGLRALLTAS